MSLWPQNPYRHHRLCTSASSSVHIHDSIGEGGSLLPADGGRKRPSWVHKRVYKLGNGLLLNFTLVTGGLEAVPMRSHRWAELWLENCVIHFVGKKEVA